MTDVREFHYLQQTESQTQFFPVPKRESRKSRRRRREKQYLERIKPFTGVPRGFYRVSEMDSPLDLNPTQPETPKPSAPPPPPSYGDAKHFPRLPPSGQGPPATAPHDDAFPPASAPPAPPGLPVEAPPPDTARAREGGRQKIEAARATARERQRQRTVRRVADLMPKAPTDPPGFDTPPAEAESLPTAPTDTPGFDTDPRAAERIPKAPPGNPLNVQGQMNGPNGSIIGIPSILNPVRQLERHSPTQFEKHDFARPHDNFDRPPERKRQRADEDSSTRPRKVVVRETVMFDPLEQEKMFPRFEVGVKSKEKNKLLDVQQVVDPADMYDMDLQDSNLDIQDGVK